MVVIIIQRIMPEWYAVEPKGASEGHGQMDVAELSALSGTVRSDP